MTLLDILGLIGSLLFFIKIGIHIYIRRMVDKEFDLGAFGQYTNPVLFFPITDEVTGTLKSLKTTGNILYLIAIILILTFIVGCNMHYLN